MSKSEVLPEGWEVATLSELADIRSGGTPSTSDASLWDGDIAWVTPTDITALGGRKFLCSTARTISRAGLRQSSAELLPEGTIVMTSRATIGECAIATIPLTTNQGFKNFIPKDRADRDFLYYLLMSQKRGFIELCSGSTFLEIGKTQLTGYTVRVPETKDEQQAIAAALSDADGVVAGLERVIAKKRLIKQGAMQDLLTARRRLPGFSGAWEVKPFAQIARIRNTKVQTLGNPVAENCIELEQVESETGRILYWADATNRATVKYQFEPGDVLFGRLRPYLRKFHRAKIQGVCSTEIWPLMTQGIDGGFLYQVIQSDGLIAAACEAYGTHMPRADWGKIATHQTQVPVDRKEQQVIGEVLADMESEIQTLESRLAKARAVKEGMMQNLLTGRVRLV